MFSLGKVNHLGVFIMTSSHRKGKSYENYIANRLNLKHTGYVGYECPDVEGEDIVIDTKHRENLPLWIKEPLQELQKQAEERLSLVIWHEKYANHDDDLVVMSLKDFERLYNADNCPKRAGNNV